MSIKFTHLPRITSFACQVALCPPPNGMVSRAGWWTNIYVCMSARTRQCLSWIPASSLARSISEPYANPHLQFWLGGSESPAMVLLKGFVSSHHIVETGILLPVLISEVVSQGPGGKHGPCPCRHTHVDVSPHHHSSHHTMGGPHKPT